MKFKASKAAKHTGSFLAGVGASIGVMLAAAEEARREEQDSLESIQEAIQAHSERYGTRVTESPYTPGKKCTAFTAFWDCEDRHCLYHRSEKEERGIGTPTRNFK